MICDYIYVITSDYIYGHGGEGPISFLTPYSFDQFEIGMLNKWVLLRKYEPCIYDDNTNLEE
jgi:hypothetical protein